MTEGRKRARANGVKFGLKFKLNHFQRQEAQVRARAALLRTYNVDAATISRLQRA